MDFAIYLVWYNTDVQSNCVAKDGEISPLVMDYWSIKSIFGSRSSAVSNVRAESCVWEMCMSIL